MKFMKSVDILIPVHNESGNIRQLLTELDEVCQNQLPEAQVWVIDDGSTDESWQEIKEACHQFSRIAGIRLNQRYGKSAALACGLQQGTAPIVVTLDGDLQDDPREIPELLRLLSTATGLVTGWKQNRRDPSSKLWASRGFNWLVSVGSGVRLHDHNCGLKAMRRDFLQTIELTPGMHRYLPVLAARAGWQVAEIPVRHRPRTRGVSKYGWSRIPAALWDLFRISVLRHGSSSRVANRELYKIAEVCGLKFTGVNSPTANAKSRT
jgi:dolichol-phosphate mannosyltransferase